jgi:serine-type D-Ala-D-Ala carboxypeptidase (penicillin-binding protein 5/6)
MKKILFLCAAVFSAQTLATIIPKPPTIAASSYILLDARSGEVIVQENADQQLPPASLTKLMTTYVVIHELVMGTIKETDDVRISVNAWRTGGSKMFVREGTTVPVIDLLRGVIIQSGNDASIALAEHVAGSEDSFADMMNQFAANLNMPNTHFLNATGLPAQGHVTTARDLATLATHIVYDHSRYYPLYKEKEFTFNGIHQPNRNLLLYWDPSVDGLKTGHTDEAGYCLVASAERDGTRLISVVMGTSSDRARAQESQKLLTYGFRYYQSHQVLAADTALQTADVWLGQEDEVGLGVDKDMVITIPRGQEGNLVVSYSVDNILKAPIAKGAQLGTLKVTLEDQVLAERPLVALNDVEQAGLIARAWGYIKLFFFKLFN